MKFFRIITADITARSQLRLPIKFVERYGAVVPGNVSLEVPTGAKWRVEVKRRNDEVWFGKGWVEFARGLSIKYGHFLMFDYDAVHAVFHVVAIGLSATEIEYPEVGGIDGEYHSGLGSSRKSLKVEEEEEHYQDDDDDDVVVIVKEKDANLGCKRRNGTQAFFSKYPRKAAKAGKSGNENGNMNEDSLIVSEDERLETCRTLLKKGKFAKKIIFNNNGSIQCVVQGRSQTIAAENLVQAKSFKTDKPVCIIMLQPSYVAQESSSGIKKKCHLPFPLCFMKEYFNLKIADATLRTNDGKTWSVKYRLAEVHRQSFFTNGWRQFAKDNDLKANDVCLFELIRGAENSMNVVIFPTASASKCLKVEEEEEEEEDYLDDDNDMIVKEKDANLGRKRRNGTQALFSEYPRKAAKAGRARKEDVNMNGDSPIVSEDERPETFGTLPKKGKLAKEIIFNSNGGIQCVVQGTRSQTIAEENLAEAKSFKTDKPVCIIGLQPSYVEQESSNGIKKKCYLLFPLCFTKAYFNFKITDATLRTNDGKTWSVKYRISEVHQQFYFTYGWRQFAMDNDLKAGDVCLFELIGEADNSMNVVIFRAPASVSKCLEAEEEEEDRDSDDDVVILEDDDVVLLNDNDVNLGHKRCNETQVTLCEYPRKTTKAIKLGNEDERPETFGTLLKKGKLAKEIIFNSKGSIQCVVQGTRSQTIAEENLAEAKSFKTDKPVCIIGLQPSYVAQESSNGFKNNCRLLFPLCFMKAYFNLKIADATLRISDGKTWSVKYLIAEGYYKSLFTYGWRQFAVDNDLKAGDVCLFELIGEAENSMNVVIFRAPASASKCLEAEEEEEYQVNDDDDVMILNDDVDVNLGHKRCNETQVASCEYPRKTAKAIKLGNEDERAGNNRTTLKRGKLAKEIMSDSKGRIQCVVQGRGNPNRAEKPLAMAKSYKTEEPVCIIVMQPYYVMRKSIIGRKKECRLRMPLRFIEAYFNLNIKNATLKTKNGKIWSVKYRLSQEQVDFSGGWRKFAMDNDLKVGDVCLFELIRGAENVLQVAIFRAGDEHEAIQ